MGDINDQYVSITSLARHEIKIKGSRFIGESFPVSSVARALQQLEVVRKREHAATHHCFAYRIGVPGEIVDRFSDDSEPSGTAGKPILAVIIGEGLTNTMVVVTRYFGGVKLGMGGLTRAYTEAARLVLEISGRREEFVTDRLKARIDFSMHDQVMRLLRLHGVDDIKADYTDRVTLDFRVRRGRTEVLAADMARLTSGRATVEKISDS